MEVWGRWPKSTLRETWNPAGHQSSEERGLQGATDTCKQPDKAPRPYEPWRRMTAGERALLPFIVVKAQSLCPSKLWPGLGQLQGDRAKVT